MSQITLERDLTSPLSETIYQQLFTHARDHLAILDEHSQFINLNHVYAQTIGYKDDIEAAFGLSYQDFKGEAALQAHQFRHQDLIVLNTKQPLEFLSYHRYAEGAWQLLHGEKTCIFDNQQNPIGIFSKARDLTHSGLIDITRFLFKDQQANFGRVLQKAFTYYISKTHDKFSLSPKEKEVLFYFIRGKTSREIANIVSRSKRTIDVHLETIKHKFAVDTKSQLIEKAIIEGYMTTIPHHMLGMTS